MGWNSGYLFYPVGTPIFFHSPLFLGFMLITYKFLSVYTALNIFSLLTYIGGGIGMFCLTYYITRHAFSSVLAGFFFMLSHDSLTQHILGHFGEANTIFLPLLFMGVIEAANNNSTWGWCLFTISALGVCMVSPYMAFCSLVFGLPFILFFQLKRVSLKKNIIPILIKTSAVVLFCLTLSTLFYLPVWINRNVWVGGSESSSLSILSFVDFPAWHPSHFIQTLRHLTSGLVDKSLSLSPYYLGRAHAMRASPENLMGFFTLTILLTTGFGFFKGVYKTRKMWGWLIVYGIVLSLGSYLQISYTKTFIPLPYLLVKHIPIFDIFRAPARLILLSWVGFCVLSSISLKYLFESIKTSLLRWVLFFSLILTFSWEMGLTQIGRWVAPLPQGAAYNLINEDPNQGAVLELPVSVNKAGDVSINAQRTLLTQPLHGRPLVIGRPPRHSINSLKFIESTTFVYELTHPVTIPLLYNNDDLKNRLQDIKNNGRNLLLNNDIQYVLFHNQDMFFSNKIHQYYKRFLTDVLGTPFLTDEDGVDIYKIY